MSADNGLIVKYNKRRKICDLLEWVGDSSPRIIIRYSGDVALEKAMMHSTKIETEYGVRFETDDTDENKGLDSYYVQFRHAGNDTRHTVRYAASDFANAERLAEMDVPHLGQIVSIDLDYKV